jgi:hypothetical protein
MVVAFALLAAVPAISPQRFKIGYYGPVALAKNSAHGEVIVATNTEVVTVDEDGLAVSKSLPVSGGGGSVVAISDDGTFVAVGPGGGEVEVFKFDSEGYGVATSLSGGSIAFGTSLSLSGNGSVLVVGAPSDFPFADVYEWNGSAYNARSTHSGAADSLFGTSVSVSADGSRFVVGAPDYDGDEGAAFVYEYNASAGTPAQLGDALELVVSGLSMDLGAVVRMSSDGNVVLAIEVSDTYAFVWNDTAWSEPTEVFDHRDGDVTLPVKVALSGDGTLAARVTHYFNPTIEIKNLTTGVVEAVSEWSGWSGNYMDDISVDLNYDGTVMVIAALGEIRAYHRDDAGSWDLTDPTAPTTAAPTTAAGAESNAESDGLSDASIAGIVAASVAVAAALGAVAYRHRGRPNVFG